MTSTYYFLILCFMSAEHALANPSVDKFMSKAFVHAAPATGAMRPGTTKLGVQPCGNVPAMSSDAEAHIALGNPGPLANMEREVARLKDEDFLLKSELQHFRSQIETMDVLQNQKQGGPEAVESSLLADLRLWASFAGAAAGAIFYSIIGKLRNRHADVTATSASFLDGAQVNLASVGVAARGGRSGIPMMKSAEAAEAAQPNSKTMMVDDDTQPKNSTESVLPAVSIAVCTGSSCESRCNFSPARAFEGLVGDSGISVAQINCMNMCKRGPNVRLVANDRVATVDQRMNELERKRKAFQNVASQARVEGVFGVAQAIADGSMQDSHGEFAVTAHGPLPPSAM